MTSNGDGRAHLPVAGEPMVSRKRRLVLMHNSDGSRKRFYLDVSSSPNTANDSKADVSKRSSVQDKQAHSVPQNANLKLSHPFKRDLQVARKFSLYQVNTWAKFVSPFIKAQIGSKGWSELILKEDIGIPEAVVGVDMTAADLRPLDELLEKIRRNIEKTNFSKMVGFHCKSTKKGSKKTSFTFEAVDKRSLSQLFRAVFHRIIPVQLFDRRRSLQRQILDNLKVFLTAGRKTPILLHHLMVGLEECHQLKWLEIVSNSIEVRIRLFAKLMIWLSTKVFWRLITGFFHVSDSGQSRNEWLFYYKPHFQAGLSRHFYNIEKTKCVYPLATSAQVQRVRAKSQHSPSLALCRLMPKKHSGRLICYKKSKGESTSRLEMDRTWRRLLYYASGRLCLDSVDVKGIKFHQEWVNFLQRVHDCERTEATTAVKPKIYIVIADIQDAFGSVIFSKLKNVLEQVTKKLPPKLYQYEIRVQNLGRAPLRKTILKEQPPPAGSADAVVEVDVQDALKKIALRSQLHTFRLKTGVKKRHFYLIKGLVQGDSLSAPLCDLYCGHLVETHLSEFRSPGPRLLVRGMDDFIFATTSRDEAEKFLLKMEQGFPDFGCSIRTEKTVTNFDVIDPDSISLLSRPEVFQKSSELTFCGSQIEPEVYSCRPNFGSYFRQNIVYASTLSCGSVEPNTIAKFILSRMLFLVGMKLQPLYLDTKLNGVETVLKNLFEINYVSALRFHSLMDSLIFQNKLDPSSFDKEFMLKLLGKCRSRLLNRYDKVCQKFKLNNAAIDDELITFTFVKAFSLVLNKHSTKYAKFPSTWRRIISVKSYEEKWKSKEDQTKMEEICNLKTLRERGTVAIISAGYRKIV